jgi:hypothetical protein
MKRTQQILSAVLVLQIVLIAVVFWPRRSASSDESRFLLDGVETADVVALTIHDIDGRELEIRRGDDGGWMLPDSGEYPVQEEKVTALLDKLVAINADRLVTRTAGSHKRLQVAADDFMRRIVVDTTDGKRRVVYLGSSPSYGTIHVRAEGENETYLTNEVSSWEVNATVESWIDTAYLSVQSDDLVALTLQNSNGQWSFEKDAEGDWTMVDLPEGEMLDESNVTLLVNQARQISMVRPLGREADASYGLDRPAGTLRLQTADRTITIEIGAKSAEDNTYVVKSSESPYYVRVSEYSVQGLLEKSGEDFVLAPTPVPEEVTPTPEGESEG